jgi:proteasome lid subunit RPN8/RPN11
MSLTLTAAALTFIKWHAERDFPNECCGILDGQGKAISAVNISTAPDHQFKIEPRWLARNIEQAGLSGIYHSHVNRPALVSKDDFQGLEIFDVLYVIASVFQGNCQDIRAYTAVKKQGKLWFEPFEVKSGAR